MNEIVQFLAKHGYAVLFLAVLAEQIGLPIPSGVVLIAAGSLAAAHSMSLSLALGLALIASLAGDSFWFMLGSWRGRSILALLCRISLEPDTCVRQTERMFTRHKVKSLLFSKFVPGLGTIAPPMAAVLRATSARAVLRLRKRGFSHVRPLAGASRGGAPSAFRSRS